MGGSEVRTTINEHVTVGRLVQQHIALTWQEAVALVLETADVLARSAPAKLPSYQAVAVGPDGTIRFLRTPERPGDPLTTLVDILRALLPTDSPSEIWDIASAAAPDSPSHDTVDRLAAALRALEPVHPERQDVLASLYQRTVDLLPLSEEDRPSPEDSDTQFAGDALSDNVPVQTLGDLDHDSTSGLNPSLVLEPTLAEIADSLNAARSCWQLSTENAERPYHRTVTEVTRVELQRSAWLVDGLRVLTRAPALDQANRNLGTILQQVFRLTKPERRLDGVRLLANLAEMSVMIRADERLAVLAYAGMLQATLAVVRHVQGAVVRCEVSTSGSAAVVTLSQDSVSLPTPLADHFFDESFHARPGGCGAAIGLAVTKRVMELHGGTTAVHTVEPTGCRVSAEIPVAAGHSEG